MALALRLAAYELLRAQGSEPVLILDDVFAELDTARRRALAGLAAGTGAGHGGGRRRHPGGWDATRIAITMREDEAGRRSEVMS